MDVIDNVKKKLINNIFLQLYTYIVELGISIRSRIYLIKILTII